MAVRWHDLNRDELNARLPSSLLIIPTGATEQHGPHLATGHDAIMIEHIAARAAEVLPPLVPAIVAPVLAFGSSAHHVPFGGTLSLSTETYYRVVREIVESAVAAGARRIFLLNGHGGNHELNQLVARDVALGPTPVIIGAASYWHLAEGALRDIAVLADVPLPGHAGLFETSTMLARYPDLAHPHLDRRPDDPSVKPTIAGVRIERSGAWQTFDGYTDRPHEATGELGERALAVVIAAVAKALTAFAALDLPALFDDPPTFVP